MVSERYGDSDFDPVSEEEDDSDGDEEEDLEASASATSSSSASQVSVVFGSFGDSVSTPPPSPWIAPVIDEFTIKIGDVPCFLVDSCCSNRNSSFEASEENHETLILDSELIVSAKSTNSNNRESEFHISEAEFKQSKHLIIDTVFTCSGPVYGVCCFAEKREPIASAVKSNNHIFQLHDEFIVDFDPGGGTSSHSLFFVFTFYDTVPYACGGYLGIEGGNTFCR